MKFKNYGLFFANLIRMHKVISKWEYIIFLMMGVLIATFFNGCGEFASKDGSISSFSINELSFKCSDPQESSDSQSYILTKKQYENSIDELFGAAVLTNNQAVLSAIPNPSNDADTQARLSSLSPSDTQAFFNAAEAIANTIVGSSSEITKVFGSCANNASPNASCIDTYLSQFAPRILRRPLNSDELTFAQTVMRQSGTYKENLKALLSYHLQSPYFLWRIELGSSGTASPGRVVSLTAFEVATRISFMASDSIPDQVLYQAAVNNQLTSQTQIKSQVRRLYQSNKGKEKLVNTLLRWGLSDNVKDLSNLPAALKGTLDTNGLEVAMLDEAKKFVEHVVYIKNGSFSDLLTSQDSFAQHRGLASIYQHNPSTGAPEKMGGRRQGLLLRSPFLTWYTERTSIIHRGVDFQKRILCNTIPLPTVDISSDRNQNALTDQEKLTYTNRDMVSHMTQSAVCMGCHSTINPTGFAFEKFDSFGRLRDLEMIFDTQGTLQNNLNVDSYGNIPLPNNQSVAVSDAFDLIDHVATSPEGSACFTKNIFRFVYEKEESNQDGCQLTDTFKIVFDQNQSIVDAMVELIANSYLSNKYMN